MEMIAPSFGISPQRIRKTAPDARAVRFTIFVIVTSPTFWLKEVFGRIPNNAAKEEPIPSQITPPESSLSVASRSIPPSITPEISPTVSTAVTINMMMIGAIARTSKTGLTGRNSGILIQLASATLFQFNTHAFVYSAPSAVIPEFGRSSPIITAAAYPAMIPMRIAELLARPFVQCFTMRITISTNSASSRFSADPKSFALLPPPKEFTPTEIRDRPIDKTTVPVTTDGKNFRSGLIKAPRTPSKRPPMIDAPMIAPYVATPPPIVSATLLNTPMNPELVPMMIGTFPPIGPIA